MVDPSKTPDQEIAYIDIASIDRERKAITEPQKLQGADAPSRARQLVRVDDVLVSTVRPNLNAVAIVPPEFDQQVASTGFCVLRADKKILNPKLIYYWVQTPAFIQGLLERVRGANYPAVRDTDVLNSGIRFPDSRHEQARIVELLEHAYALRRQRDEADTKHVRLLPALFRHYFGDALDGKVVKNSEPLGTLLTAIDSGISPRCLDRPANANEWAVLKLGAVTWCRFDDTENKALPSDVVPDPSIEVHPGDLLFARKNTLELVGATVLVRSTRPHMLLPDLIFRLQPKSDAPVTKEYLWALFMQEGMRNRLRAIASGAAGSMPNISKGRLETLDIPLPDLEIQKSFSKQVHAALDLETQAAASTAKLETLFQVLLHRAFTGELTAKWREAHLREGVQEMNRLSRM